MAHNLYSMFRATADAYPDSVALACGRAGASRSMTYREMDAAVRACSQGLEAYGVRRGDRFAIVSENRPEWAIADLACQRLGVVVVGVYPSLPAEQIAGILSDAGACAVAASDRRLQQRVAIAAAGVPSVKSRFAFDPAERAEGWTAWADIGLAGSGAVTDAGDAGPGPDDVATFIYTSGTTGTPRAAMLTHRALMHVPEVVVRDQIAELGRGTTFLSFLPLSHITERVGGHYLPLRAGCTIRYSDGLAALRSELTSTVRPNIMLCVPRLLDAMCERAEQELRKLAGFRGAVARWAVDTGARAADERSRSGRLGLMAHIATRLAELLVLRNLRRLVTGGNLRYIVSGGAPLDRHTARFFLGLNVELLEGYGLSETSIMAVNRPGRQRLGTVGTLLPEVEVQIAEDGEILTRGPGNFTGYFNRPAETAEAIDAEGWFHTGDIGSLSADGFLSITDRKKDLLVLSNGKKVAPQPIEAALKRSPFIEEAVLLGDRHQTVAALIVPDSDAVTAWMREHGGPAEPAQHAESDALKALIRTEIDAQTPGLADYERIRKFALLPARFTIEGGELTPTLKVRRRVVMEKYAAQVAAVLD